MSIGPPISGTFVKACACCGRRDGGPGVFCSWCYSATFCKHGVRLACTCARRRACHRCEKDDVERRTL